MRAFTVVVFGLCVFFFSFRAFSENLEEYLSLPNHGSTEISTGYLIKSLAAEECATTPNAPNGFTPKLENQEAFKLWYLYYNWHAERAMRTTYKFRSCAVIRGWPKKIKSTLKNIMSNKNFLMDFDADTPSHWKNFHSPKWLRVSPEVPVLMKSLGLELAERGVSLGEFRKICHGINLKLPGADAPPTTQELSEWLKEVDIINDNGKALSYKFCSDSEIALKHDMVVAKYYEKLSGLYEDDYLAVLNEILPKIKVIEEKTDKALEMEAKLSGIPNTAKIIEKFTYEKWIARNSLCPAEYKLSWSDAFRAKVTSENPYLHQLLKKATQEFPEEMRGLLNSTVNNCEDSVSVNALVSAMESYSQDSMSTVCPNVILFEGLLSPITNVLDFDAPIFDMLEKQRPDWTSTPDQSACKSSGSFVDAGEVFSDVVSYRDYLYKLGVHLSSLLVDQGVSEADLPKYLRR